MKNITLAVPDETLREVRRLAAERDTTVNALVRAYLEGLASHKTRRAKLRRELDRFAKASRARVGTVHWSRTDAHER